MENKQTAVDFLLHEISKIVGIIAPDAFSSALMKIKYDQAKAMEKEQIIDARVSGFASSAEGWNGEIPCMKWSEMVRETKCEEYYNENYGKDNL
jgi:hypothetical protein